MYSSFQVRMEHNNKLWEKHGKSFIALVRFKWLKVMGIVSIFIFFLLWFKYFWIAKLDSSQPIKYAMTMLWNWNCCKSKILANQLTVHLHACLYLHVTCPYLETYEYLLYWCLFSTYSHVDSPERYEWLTASAFWAIHQASIIPGKSWFCSEIRKRIQNTKNWVKFYTFWFSKWIS